jgi:hypothetical protein
MGTNAGHGQGTPVAVGPAKLLGQTATIDTGAITLLVGWKDRNAMPVEDYAAYLAAKTKAGVATLSDASLVAATAHTASVATVRKPVVTIKGDA